MAITGTQSTSQILAAQAAANREAQAQAQINTPQLTASDQIRGTASNPIGLISQGIATSTNALNAGNRRAESQAQIDHAAALRNEQQAYTRGQKAVDRTLAAEATTYNRNQDSVVNQRLQEAQDSNLATQKLNRGIATLNKNNATIDRNAQIAGERANVELQEATSKLDQLQKAEMQEYFTAQKLAPNSPVTQLAYDVSNYDKERAESGGGTSYIDRVDKLLAKDLQGKSKVLNNIQDDVKRAGEGGANWKGYKDTLGAAYDKAYEPLAIERAYQQLQIGNENWVADGGDVDAEQLSKLVAAEFIKIAEAKLHSDAVNTIQNRYTQQKGVLQLNAARKSLR